MDSLPHPADHGRGAIVVASASLILVALPVFLVGGLAVQIRAELGIGASAIGAVVSATFLISAATAPLVGRAADRLGARTAVTSGLTLSVLVSAAIALFARSGWHLAAILAVSGVAIAITDPGLAILLTREVPPQRLGIAFGLKEASIPAAMLVAGLAVPLVALTAGWRWAFALGAVPLAVVVALRDRIPARPSVPLPAASPDPPTERARDAHHGAPPPRATLVLITAGTALGIAAASGVAVFLTQSAVAAGLSPSGAGALLATASAGGVVVRVVAGVAADRLGGDHLRTIAAMLGVGGVLLVTGALGSTTLLAVSTVGAFAAVWGWTGLLFLSLVRALPDTPGAAAGVAVAGLTTGNGTGPLLFGVIAERASFTAAWTTAGALSGAGCLLVLAAAQRVRSG
jgi:predicted MFS family arabinose efflux permease